MTQKYIANSAPHALFILLLKKAEMASIEKTQHTLKTLANEDTND